MPTFSSFVVETRRTIVFFRWTFPCLSGVLSFCGIVCFNRASWSISFAFPLLCRVMFERTFSAYRARVLLTSKIDNLCLFLQLLSTSTLLLLSLLIAFFWEINMFCCCLSKMSSTTVLNIWSLLGSFFTTKSCWYSVIACFMRKDSLHSSLIQVLQTMFIQIIPKGQQCFFSGLIQNLDCRCAIRRLANHSSSSCAPESYWCWRTKLLETWNCLPVSIGRLFLNWVSSKKVVFL